MKYLFAVLMWNDRAEEPEPEDIFAVCCQLYGPEGIVSYGHYVRPADRKALTEQTKERVYHNIAALEMAKPLKATLDVVARTFPEYDVLVMWSRRSYELFRRAMHQAGHHLRTSRVVFLEELASSLVAPRAKHPKTSFRGTLRLFGLKIPYRDCYQPKLQAAYLFQIWDRLGQLAEKSPAWAQTELYYNEATKRAHLPDCRFARQGGVPCGPQILLEGGVLCRECQKREKLYFWTRGQVHDADFALRTKVLAEPQNYPPSPTLLYREDDPQKRYHTRFCSCYRGEKTGPDYLKWKPVFREDELRAAGWKRCDLCSPVGVRFQQMREQAEAFCRQRGMTCEMQDGVLDVVTPVGSWKIVFVGKGKLWLYHKNTRKSHLTEREDIPGYHTQAIHDRNIMELLEYIVQHDMYRKNHPEGQAKKQEKPRQLTNRGRNSHRPTQGAAGSHYHHHRKKEAVKAFSLEELQLLAQQKRAAAMEQP